MGLTKRLCEIYLLEICRRFKLKTIKLSDLEMYLDHLDL